MGSTPSAVPEKQAGRAGLVEKVRGAPTSQGTVAAEVASERAPARPAAPVGLNWASVAAAFQVDQWLLEREGAIVLRGQDFPERGYAISPSDYSALPVTPAEYAAEHVYFLGDVTMGHLGRQPAVISDRTQPRNRVRPSRPTSLTGLFVEREGAERARRKIVQGSLATPASIESGPLGTEVRVRDAQMSGRAATTMAALGGAIISVDGEPLFRSESRQRDPIKDF